MVSNYLKPPQRRFGGFTMVSFTAPATQRKQKLRIEVRGLGLGVRLKASDHCPQNLGIRASIRVSGFRVRCEESGAKILSPKPLLQELQAVTDEQGLHPEARVPPSPH